MVKYKKEVEYKLSEEFEYNNNNKAQTITLKSPSRDLYPVANRLKQDIVRALKELENQQPSEAVRDKVENTVSDDDKKIKGEEILLIIMRSSVDYSKFSDDLISILISNCAFINGVDILKEGHINKIGYGELEELFGCYIENFLLASVISGI